MRRRPLRREAVYDSLMGGAEAERAVSAVLAGGRKLVDSVRGLSDTQLRVILAGKLADGLRALADEAARIRQDGAAEIYEREKLTLAALAGRVGISAARAGQLVQAARKRDAKQAEENGDA